MILDLQPNTSSWTTLDIEAGTPTKEIGRTAAENLSSRARGPVKYYVAPTYVGTVGKAGLHSSAISMTNN